MKHRFFLLLLLTGCQSASNKTDYENARKLATKHVLTTKQLTFGFKTDMSRRVAEARVKQLDESQATLLPLPSGIKLEITSFMPAYIKDTLAELGLYFYRFQPADYTSLQELLATRYNQPGFAHRFFFDGRDAGSIVSWFDGPLEIQLIRTEFWLDVNYIDLRREPHLLTGGDDE